MKERRRKSLTPEEKAYLLNDVQTLLDVYASDASDASDARKMKKALTVFFFISFLSILVGYMKHRKE